MSSSSVFRYIFLLCTVQLVSSFYIPSDFPLSEDRTVNGIPVDKYFKSLARLNEIELKLNGVNPAFTASINKTSSERHSDGTNVTPVDLMMSPYLFQGDILLTESQLDEMLAIAEAKLAQKSGNLPILPSNTLRNPLLEQPSRRWKMPIPYFYEYADGGLQMLKRGMKLWTDGTCVRFEELRSIPSIQPYLRIRPTGGCSASWGYNGYGRFREHSLSLPRGCGTPAIVAHELGHTLGLYHTQSRVDRNNYVQIIYRYIMDGQSYNFDIAPAPTITLGIPYEYGSVMHYSPTAFTAYAGYKTVVTKDSRYQNTIGYREGLTFYDLKIVNLAYCDTCSTDLDCLHDGYTDPLNCTKCRCPSGFSGTYCEEVEKTSSNCGQIEYEATPEYQTVSFRGIGNCNFFIKGNGSKVQVVLEQYPSIMPYSLVCELAYLEVKFKQDLGLTGARFCGANRIHTIPFQESTDKIMLIYKGNYYNDKFSVKFKSDGPAVPKPPSTPKPTTTPMPTTSASTVTATTTPTTPPLSTTTIPTTTNFRGDSWSPWSPCSYNCGGCGTRQRHNQAGNVQSDYCNTQPCPGYYCCKPFFLSTLNGRWYCLKSIHAGPPPPDGTITSNLVKFVANQRNPTENEGSGIFDELNVTEEGSGEEFTQ